MQTQAQTQAQGNEIFHFLRRRLCLRLRRSCEPAFTFPTLHVFENISTTRHNFCQFPKVYLPLNEQSSYQHTGSYTATFIGGFSYETF